MTKLLPLLLLILHSFSGIAQSIKLDWECVRNMGDRYIMDCQYLTPDNQAIVYSVHNKVYLSESGQRNLDLGKPYVFTNIHMIDERQGFITAYQESLDPMNPGGSLDGILIRTND